MNSIRRRILLPLTLLIGLALCLTAWGIDRSVRSDLLEGLDRTLMVMARGIASAIDVEIGGNMELDLEGPDALAFENPSRVIFFVIRLDEDEVWESSIEPAPDSPPLRQDEPTFRTQEVDGETYRIITFALEKTPEDDEEDLENWLEDNPGQPAPAPDAIRFAVTVGHATTEVEATMTTLRTRLFLGFGLLFLGLLLVPGWVVSRALAPLHRLSVQADEVGPEAARSRLDESGVDREVLKLVAALNRALGRVNDAYQRQKRFTADAAHELRTPLSAIRTQCEVALRRKRDIEELRADVEGVHATSCRMGDVVESLLMLSRLQPQELFEQMPELDLYEACREAVAINLPAARSKEVALELDGDTALVRGDLTLLVECVSNLIENAIRFTPSNGTVVVNVADAGVVTISDTGIGIEADQLEKIFERFYRIDKARSRAEGGSGLGLSIVREIARLHEAKVSVESKPGKGSIFRLEFTNA